MIRSLSGTVTDHVRDGLILEVAGVGYLVSIPLRSLPAVGSTVRLYTHHHVREQEQALYGFSTLAELASFESLLAVSGIGPKSALAILTIASSGQLEGAIETDDVGFFASVPGIGKKTAARIIVELKGKLLAPSDSPGLSDLRAALESLGYAPRDVEPLTRTLPADLIDIQDQLGWILRQLGQR